MHSDVPKFERTCEKMHDFHEFLASQVAGQFFYLEGFLTSMLSYEPPMASL